MGAEVQLNSDLYYMKIKDIYSIPRGESEATRIPLRPCSEHTAHLVCPFRLLSTREATPYIVLLRALNNAMRPMGLSANRPAQELVVHVLKIVRAVIVVVACDFLAWGVLLDIVQVCERGRMG